MERLVRILYAEDNLNDIELTLAALQENNLNNHIDVVHDGEEALDYLFYRNNYVTREKTVPSFMLLDIKMPKLNGIDVLKEIRKSEEYKNLPVIVLTSSQIEADAYESYKLGVNAVVVKPIGFTEFVKAIKRIGSFWGIYNVGPCN